MGWFLAEDNRRSAAGRVRWRTIAGQPTLQEGSTSFGALLLSIAPVVEIAQRTLAETRRTGSRLQARRQTVATVGDRPGALVTTSRPQKHFCATDRAMQRNQEHLQKMAAGTV